MAPAVAMRAAFSSPMFAAVAPWLVRLPAERFPSLRELNGLVGPHVKSGGGMPIRFVEPRTAAEEPYESGIFRTGLVPTRADNWHDLFNALVWLSFPLTKALLNRRHCEEMSRHGHDAGRRGTARDVLTLFDEGGVIVLSSDDALLELLRGFEWKELFWHRRAALERCMRFLVFGHAILEKSLEPYKGVTAKALLLQAPASLLAASVAEQLAGADDASARWFAAKEALASTRNLAPLPVLGVPGWADNEASAFYDDATVFRPGYRGAGPPA
jgi:hypothetical protein